MQAKEPWGGKDRHVIHVAFGDNIEITYTGLKERNSDIAKNIWQYFWAISGLPLAASVRCVMNSKRSCVLVAQCRCA